MNTQPEWLRTSAYGCLRGVLLGGAVLLSAWLGWLDGMERWELNQLFALRGPIQPRSPITIISIDEDSFDELNLPWPWPRALHGQLLDVISQGRPAVVGLDILFAEPSSQGPEDDRALAEAVTRAGNVVLSAARTVVHDAFFVKTDLNPPIEQVRGGAAGIGLVNFAIDADAFVRTADLRSSSHDAPLPDFDLVVYRLAVSSGIPAHPFDGGEFYVNYRGGRGTFETVPYHKVLSGEVSPDALTGKIVLVGATSPALHDVYPTPYAVQGEMPGVEIHANVVETLVQGIELTPVPRWFRVAAILLSGVIAVLVTQRLGPLMSLVTVVGVAGACGLAGFTAFVHAFAIPGVTPVILALGLGYGTTLIDNILEERRRRAELIQLFSPYVGPQILHELLKDPEKARQGSRQRREVTLLFCDVVGFVKFCESHSVDEIVLQMNEYLGAMTEAVFHWGGTLIDFKGDEVYALWGAPLDQPDHVERAVKCAIHMRQQLDVLNGKWAAEGKTQLQNGVGLNTGQVLFANMGATGKRMKFEAVGDCVNLASRVEGLTRKFGVDILMTEFTAERVKPLLLERETPDNHGRLGHVMVRKVAAVKVKGRDQPVVVYELKPLDRQQPSQVIEPETVDLIVMTEK